MSAWKMTINQVRDISFNLGFEFLSDAWNGSYNNKYTFRCLEHNEIHQCRWDKIIQNKSIKCCWIEKLKNIKKPTGKDHPNYNPDLTIEQRQDRNYFWPYQKWKIAIKNKFNFTCQICFKSNLSGNNCIAHHLNSYMAFPDIQSDVNNGVCLCENCHISFHKMYGFGKNTDSQYKEFTKIKQGAKR